MKNVEELLDRLGDIPWRRIRLKPRPGTATEKDVLRAQERDNVLCELVDGTLVEKAVGFQESFLALKIARLIGDYADAHDLGITTGADGIVKLLKGLVRIPDVSFVSWDHLPGRVLPREPIPELAPDLAVEVISEGNTPGEMKRKLREYFLAGVRLVWFVDPQTRTGTTYTSPEEAVTADESGALDGGAVLPGFKVPLAPLFQ